MNTRRYIPILLAFSLYAVFPFHARAQTCSSAGFSTDGSMTPCTLASNAPASQVTSTPGNGGIFSCSAPGASSIASASALGGTYVPVSDSAVELNTGTLTYKTCVLQELANQQKQAVTVAYVQQEYSQLSSGRNGNPYWVVNYGNDQQKVADTAVNNTVNSGLFQTINPAFQSQVQTAVLRNYYATTRAPQDALACPYANLESALDGQTTDVLGALGAFVQYPACNPYQAYAIAQNQVNNNIGAAESEWLNRLNWNNGIYDAQDTNGNVVVPGILLNAVATQAMTSGFRQLENANDIGQMVGQFFTGIGSYLLSGPSSVAGVQQYIGNAVQQQQNSLASSAISTGLTNLYQIIKWEQQYNGLQQQMASTISSAIVQLRGAESTCWTLITQNVCTGAVTSTPSGGAQCTSKSGATLTIATSTAFSSAVITSSNFAALAQALASRIDVSNQNLATLNILAAELQSADSAKQNLGLSQLNTIINANPPVLHVQANITQAQDELTQVQAAIAGQQTGVVLTTIQGWAGNDTNGGKGTIGWNGDPSSGAGWCNVPTSSGSTPSAAQQQTLTNWTSAWTH